MLAEVGHRGGEAAGEVWWRPLEGFWFVADEPEVDSNRFWNAFGLDNPYLSKNLSIVCEANPPISGLDRQIGGVFAVRTTDNHLHVLHRGVIAGGRKGVSKRGFWDNYRRGRVSFDDGTGDNDFAVVLDVDADRALWEMAEFVREVGRIKELLTRPA